MYFGLLQLLLFVEDACQHRLVDDCFERTQLFMESSHVAGCLAQTFERRCVAEKIVSDDALRVINVVRNC